MVQPLSDFLTPSEMRSSDANIQRIILEKYSGIKRSQAALAYAHTLNYRIAWGLESLLAMSVHPDAKMAPKEWAPAMGSLEASTYYSHIGASCEFDKVPIKWVTKWINEETNRVLRLGKICSYKLHRAKNDPRFLFGIPESDIHHGQKDSDADDMFSKKRKLYIDDSVNPNSFFQWFEDQHGLPDDIQSIFDHVCKHGTQFSQSEVEIMWDFYAENRFFGSEELLGVQLIEDISAAFGNFWDCLPDDIQRLLNSTAQTTIIQAEPLALIYHENPRKLITSIFSNVPELRYEIDEARLEIEDVYGDGISFAKKCNAVLKYIELYEEVMGHSKHLLSRLIFPSKIYKHGWILGQEDLNNIANAYENHGHKTEHDLIIKKDEFLRRRRAKNWKELREAGEFLALGKLRSHVVSNVLNGVSNLTYAEPMERVITAFGLEYYNKNSDRIYVTFESVKKHLKERRGMDDPEEIAREIFGRLHRLLHMNEEGVVDPKNNKFTEVLKGKSIGYQLPEFMFDEVLENVEHHCQEFGITNVNKVKSQYTSAMYEFEALVNEVITKRAS